MGIRYLKTLYFLGYFLWAAYVPALQIHLRVKVLLGSDIVGVVEVCGCILYNNQSKSKINIMQHILWFISPQSAVKGTQLFLQVEPRPLPRLEWKVMRSFPPPRQC